MSLTQMIFTVKHTVNERELFSIECSKGEVLKISDAKWQYKISSITNMFKLRTQQFIQSKQVGNYIGKGKWDLTQQLIGWCSGRNECHFVPSTQLFVDCGCKMCFQVEYECEQKSNTIPKKKKN